jgi:hypothetical protein
LLGAKQRRRKPTHTIQRWAYEEELEELLGTKTYIKGMDKFGEEQK